MESLVTTEKESQSEKGKQEKMKQMTDDILNKRKTTNNAKKWYRIYKVKQNFRNKCEQANHQWINMQKSNNCRTHCRSYAQKDQRINQTCTHTL